jgi:hypothetical protein
LVQDLLNRSLVHDAVDGFSSSGREIDMRLLLMASGIVLGFLAVADFASSQATDERTHLRWAAEAGCLDTNTAALPEVQRMCAAQALREVPDPASPVALTRR